MPFYAGRVKCIAIDPPYNTRSAFAHYDDTKEKDLFGKLWAQADPARHIFLVISERDAQGRDMRSQILSAIG
jgi:hypothetical protein